MKLIDLTGKQFGYLTVIERDFLYQKNNNLEKPYWKCKCECGNVITVNGKLLREGKTTSCGCHTYDFISKINFDNKIGKRYGRLVVIKYVGNSKWECLCDCGNKTIVRSCHLTSGHTISCGCLKSKGEYNIGKFLLEKNISYKKEFTIPTLKNSRGNLVRIDFAIFINNEIKAFIEYNGKQHYNKNDPWYKEVVEEGLQLKKEYAIKNNILFFEIKYNDDLNKELNNIFSVLNG